MNGAWNIENESNENKNEEVEIKAKLLQIFVKKEKIADSWFFLR